jgi:hypothetical protein
MDRAVRLSGALPFAFVGVSVVMDVVSVVGIAEVVSSED